MKIKDINLTNTGDSKVSEALDKFNRFMKLLGEHNIPEHLIHYINTEIDELNAAPASNRSFLSILKKKQNNIITKIEKELKLVPKNHYRNYWMILGMSIFGLPLGVAVGLSLDNMGFLGLGLPIGILIGYVLGTSLDNKALEQGKQIDIELK